MESIGSGLAVCFVFLALGVVGVRLTSGARSRAALQLFTAAIVVRVLVLIILDQLGLARQVGLDGVFYDEVGRGEAIKWSEHGLDLSWLWRQQRYHRYCYLVGTVYYFAGPHVWAASFLNIVLGGLMAATVYLVAGRHFDERIGWRAGLFVSFLPSLIVWTSLLMKEAPALLAIVMCFGAVLSLRERFALRHVVTLAAGIWILEMCRTYVAIVVAMVATLALIMTGAGAIPTRLVKGIAVLVVGGALLAVRGHGFMGLGWEGIRGGIKAVNAERLAVQSGARSAYLREAKFETEAEAAQFLPVGVFYFLFSPLPWQLHESMNRLILLELPFWYAAILFAVIGLRYLISDPLQRSKGIILTVFLLSLSAVYGLASGNVGTAFRHRAQVAPLFLVAAACGYTYRERRRLTRVAAFGRTPRPEGTRPALGKSV